jgi:hypothetical protein
MAPNRFQRCVCDHSDEHSGSIKQVNMYTSSSSPPPPSS